MALPAAGYFSAVRLVPAIPPIDFYLESTFELIAAFCAICLSLVPSRLLLTWGTREVDE